MAIMKNKLIISNKDIAYKIYDGLRNAIKQQGLLFLFIGKALKQIRDEDIYKELGYDSFAFFLQDPELKQKPSTSYAYIRIYEYYIEQLGMVESEVINVGMNRLQMLLPALKKKTDEDAREIISSVGELTHLDYKQEIKERGLDIERPSLYRDAETGLWIIEFTDGTVQRIYNRSRNLIIPLDVN